MDISEQLSLSYYKELTLVDEAHGIYIVQHVETKKIFVKKILHVYNTEIYRQLQATPIKGIPRIIELFEDQETLTVIEEYVSGETLQEKIASRSLTQADVFTYVNDLCTIVMALHRLRPPIIHRDIKPSNVMVSANNEVYLLDFNASKHYRREREHDTVLLGTKGYAAPEQYGFGSSSPQTDIYAIGVLLQELVYSLKKPTHKYDRIITSCTQLEPNQRYASVTVLQQCLQAKGVRKKAILAEPRSKRRFLPPGFRLLSPWRMILATPGYALLIYLFFRLDLDNSQGVLLWVERLLVFLMLISYALIGANYLDIRSLMPISKSRKRLLRYVGIVLLDITFTGCALILIVIAQSIL